jgi:hypothetical protein
MVIYAHCAARRLRRPREAPELVPAEAVQPVKAMQRGVIVPAVELWLSTLKSAAK